MNITKKAYRGSMYLLVLVILIMLANQWMNSYYFEKLSQTSDPDDARILDSLIALIPKDSAKSQYSFEKHSSAFEKKGPQIPLNLHDFDPNSVSKEEWVGMGLPERVFNGFEKYRSKGGQIRKPEQIAKLYNLDPELASKMIPFVKLDSALFTKSKFEQKPRIPFPEKKVKVLFDLNLADTTQLMGVYGIGRGLANRIVRHRDGLGGFYRKEDVYDVFALDSSVVEELFTKAFLPENPIVQKRNINVATEEELAKNPYIRKGLAKIIIKYRTQHGNYKTAEDLLKIKIIKPEVVEKVKPYLEF